MPGEFDFIDWIRSQVPSSPLVQTGIGDDLAVLKWDPADLLLVGVDQVLDGVHFDSAKHAPDLIGRKVINRNLSDCAAMACLPATAVATVALPRKSVVTPFSEMGSLLIFCQQLFLGMKQAADAFDCSIVGGDTASWDGPLAMTVTILGRSAGITPLTRSGAKAGDGIYVTGPLGGSILGRHLTFTPRIHLARQLAATGNVTAMIDLSDGISRDLRHICRQSNVGAILDANAIPIHDDALTLAREDHLAPLHHALHDGEDHELLLTGQLAHDTLITRIGTIVEGDQILLRHHDRTVPLDARGWEHVL
jgi:thiamine-monophosphate kinase